MRIDPDVLTIIDGGHTEGNVYFLPEGQLDRKMYVKVNKVLTALGGKWNRKAKGHIFDKPIDDTIENVILTGEVVDKKKELQFFETPRKIADILCDLADVESMEKILEPEAGKGAILKVIRERNPDADIFWCEIDEENIDHVLEMNIATRVGSDFIKYKPSFKFDLVDGVVMNPPFSKQQDIDHVTHALDFVKDGGVLVSVMSPSIKYRTNRKTKEFLELISQYDFEIIDLPEGSFKESGTNVKTIILKVEK